MTPQSNSGLMQERSTWEKDYQAGRWNYLSGGEESIRYAAIASVIRRRQRPVSILDVGCGEGLMLKYVAAESISKYTGLDLAQAASDRVTQPRSVDRLVCNNRCARRVRRYFEEASFEIDEAVEILKLQKKLSWQLFAVKPNREENQ